MNNSPLNNLYMKRNPVSTNASSTRNPINYRNNSRQSVFSEPDPVRSKLTEKYQESSNKRMTTILPNKSQSRMIDKKYEEGYQNFVNESNTQKKQLYEYRENYRKLLNENENQKENLREYRENYRKLFNENENQKKNLRDLQKKLYKMERNYCELTINYDKLKDENEKLRDKDDFLMTSNSSTNFKVSSVHNPDRLKYNGTFQELEKMKTEMERSHTKYQNLMMKCKKYKENYQKLLNENESLKENLREMKVLLENNERLTLENNNFTKEIELLKNENYQDKLKYKENYQKLLNENENQKKHLREYEEEYQNLVNEDDKLKTQLYIDTLESEKNNSIKKIEELEADLQKKQNAIRSIRSKYKTLQSNNDELSGLTVFKIQSLSLQKQNEDFKHQVNNLTKLNENVTTQLELMTNENYQLKAEIKNMKLLKFGSKPTSSISANIQDPCVDENEKSQVKNEYSTQSIVNNDAESRIKDKNNINVQKFPAWWSKHMCPEISSNQMETTKNENSKSKVKIKDTELLMIPYKSISHNSDYYYKNSHNSIDINEKLQVENKNSTQTYVDIVTEPSKKDKIFPKNRTHSNIYPAWWSNHVFYEK